MSTATPSLSSANSALERTSPSFRVTRIRRVTGLAVCPRIAPAGQTPLAATAEKRSANRIPYMAGVCLLPPKDEHRIDPRRPARGNVRGKERRTREDQRRPNEHAGIRRTRGVEDGSEQACGRKRYRGSARNADDRHAEDRAQHQTTDVA